MKGFICWVVSGLDGCHPTTIPSNPQHNPERPTRPREPDHHHHNGLREGRGMLKGVGMNWRGELVVRVGWRLSDRSLRREVGELG